MRPLVHCPSCGAKLPASSEAFKATCAECGETWYRNPAPTAGCAIVRDGRVLISRRGIEPYKGRFDVVGGFISLNESALDAVRREVKEETGLDIDVSIEDCLQIEPHRYGDDGEWTLAIGFKARWIGGEPTPADDVAELRWIDAAELDSMDFAWPHDKALARKALEA